MTARSSDSSPRLAQAKHTNGPVSRGRGGQKVAERDLSQREIAFEKANRVRLEQARVHRSISALPRREALVVVAGLLDDPPEIVARMAVHYLLRSIHRLEWTLAERYAIAAGLTSRMLKWRIGPLADRHQTLTERQRRVLAETLRERAEARE